MVVAAMSDRPEGVLVRMLRWIDSGVGRLLERMGRTEQQVGTAQLSISRIFEQLDRIERRLEDIERRLPPRAGNRKLAVRACTGARDKLPKTSAAERRGVGHPREASDSDRCGLGDRSPSVTDRGVPASPQRNPSGPVREHLTVGPVRRRTYQFHNNGPPGRLRRRL